MAERTQQLSDSQKRYKALFDLAADSIFMVDAECRIIGVNKREEQTLGYTETESMGRTFLDLVPPEYRHLTASLIEKIVEAKARFPRKKLSSRIDPARFVPSKWI